MYRLIRFYNQNRKKIFKIILIIVFIIAIIQLLNFLEKLNNEKNTVQNSIIANNNKIDTEQGTGLVTNKSAISGDSIPDVKLKRESNIISDFMDYCNDRKVSEAYALLSDDCKEQLFETEQIFKTNYYDVIFDDEVKIFTIENWIGSTYKVEMSNDILATGSIKRQNTDYFTIVEQEDEYKLNIKNYIGKTDTNGEAKYNDVKIKVVSSYAYMDYEIYDIQIMNNSENDILLDTKNDSKTIYLENSNGGKYYAYTNEIIDNEFIVRKGKSKNLKIKFSKSFSSNNNIKYLNFSDFILNYNDYEEYENKEDYEDRYQFIVSI